MIDYDYCQCAFSVSHFACAGCSPLLEECLEEFYSTYDDTLLQWNGAGLMTRVISNLSSKADENMWHLHTKLEPSATFYPISSTDIMRYDLYLSICADYLCLINFTIQKLYLQLSAINLDLKDNIKL